MNSQFVETIFKNTKFIADYTLFLGTLLFHYCQTDQFDELCQKDNEKKIRNVT